MTSAQIQDLWRQCLLSAAHRVHLEEESNTITPSLPNEELPAFVRPHLRYAVGVDCVWRDVHLFELDSKFPIHALDGSETELDLSASVDLGLRTKYSPICM